MDRWGVPFQSYVDIQLTRPYRLEINELSTYVDLDAYSHNHNKVDIDIYYMTPTVKGIRFVENRGLDSPVVVEGEGSHFHTSYVQHTNDGIRFKGGVVMVESGRLTVDKIQKDNGSGRFFIIRCLPLCVLRDIEGGSILPMTTGKVDGVCGITMGVSTFFILASPTKEMCWC